MFVRPIDHHPHSAATTHLSAAPPPIAPGGLELRLLDHRDIDALATLLSEEQRWLGAWLPWVDPLVARLDASSSTSLGPVAAWIQDGLNRYATQRGLRVGLFEGGQLIGGLELEKWDATNRKGQIFCWLRERSCGGGRMTRALASWIDWLFEELDVQRLTARFPTTHVAARRLVERLDFQHEGTIRRTAQHRGRWYDDDLFGRLRAQP